MLVLTANRLSGQVRNRRAITRPLANAPSHHPNQRSVHHALSQLWQGIGTSDGDRQWQPFPRKFYLHLDDILWGGRNDHRHGGLRSNLGGLAWAS